MSKYRADHLSSNELSLQNVHKDRTLFNRPRPFAWQKYFIITIQRLLHKIKMLIKTIYVLFAGPWQRSKLSYNII